MGKPQDLPAGTAQMRFGIGLAFMTYVMALVVPFGIGRAVVQAAIDLACTALVLRVALVAMGRAARFEQSFGGFCGASVFINLAAMPMYLTRGAAYADNNASVGALPDYILLVWGLSVFAHIVRHTFEVKMVTSVLIAFLYFMVLSTLISALIPLKANAGLLPVSSVMLPISESEHNVSNPSLASTFAVVASSSRMV